MNLHTTDDLFDFFVDQINFLKTEVKEENLTHTIQVGEKVFEFCCAQGLTAQIYLEGESEPKSIVEFVQMLIDEMDEDSFLKEEASSSIRQFAGNFFAERMSLVLDYQTRQLANDFIENEIRINVLKGNKTERGFYQIQGTYHYMDKPEEVMQLNLGLHSGGLIYSVPEDATEWVSREKELAKYHNCRNDKKLLVLPIEQEIIRQYKRTNDYKLRKAFDREFMEALKTKEL